MDNVGNRIRQSFRRLTTKRTTKHQTTSHTVGQTPSRKVSLSAGEQPSALSAYESNLSAGKQPLAECSGARARKSMPLEMEEVILTGQGATSQQSETSRAQTCASSGAIETTSLPASSLQKSTAQSPSAEEQTQIVTIDPLSDQKNMHKQKKWQKSIQHFFRKTSSKTIADIKSREKHPLQDLSSKYSVRQQLALAKKHSVALAEVASQFTPQTSKECQNFHKYCRQYILKGKGRKVLEQSLSPTVVITMKKGLPDIPVKYFLHNYPSVFVKFNETHRMTDATHIPAQKAVTEDQHVGDMEEIEEMTDTTVRIPFNPNNERHKTAIILSRLNDMYRSVSQSITERAGLLEDIDESTRMLEQAETLKSMTDTIDLNILALMHALMKKEWPMYFDDSYQHVVITDEHGEYSYLNLDSYQPRGGYFDKKPLTPVGPL